MAGPTAAAPSSDRAAANAIVSRELYDLFMTDRLVTYTMTAQVDGGVVTLRGFRPSRGEAQRLNSRIRELPGVTEVRDERGASEQATPPVAQR